MPPPPIKEGAAPFLDGSPTGPGPAIVAASTERIGFGSEKGAGSFNIKFAKPYSKPPRIFHGLSRFDVAVAGSKICRLRATVDSITNEGFHLDVISWGGSTVWGTTATWLEIPDTPAFAEVAAGSFNTQSVNRWVHQKEVITRRVKFGRPYADGPPIIAVWLSNFDLSIRDLSEVRACAIEVTDKGFLLSTDNRTHRGSMVRQPAISQFRNRAQIAISTWRITSHRAKCCKSTDAI